MPTQTAEARLEKLTTKLRKLTEEYGKHKFGQFVERSRIGRRSMKGRRLHDL